METNKNKKNVSKKHKTIDEYLENEISYNKINSNSNNNIIKNNEVEDEYDDLIFNYCSKNKKISENNLFNEKILHKNKLKGKSFDYPINIKFEKKSNIDELNFLDKNFPKLYLKDYSVILKEFNKTAKNKAILNKLSYSYESKLNLAYRASLDKKFSFDNFLKFQKNTLYNSFVLKTSLDIFYVYIYNFIGNEKIYGDYNKKRIYLFDKENCIELNNKNCGINEERHEIFNEYFIVNNYSFAEIIKDIHFKNKTISKGTRFYITNAEIFGLKNKKEEKIVKEFRPFTLRHCYRHYL